MQYINLTPHAVTVLDEDNNTIAEYPASGKVARLATESIGSVGDTHTVQYGALNGLPRRAEGTRYIVSLVCLLSLQGTREDVVAPWIEVRDETGVIGCRGLHRLARTVGATYVVDGYEYQHFDQAVGASRLADANGYQFTVDEIPRP